MAKLENCPDFFYINCANAPKRCNSCSAGKGNPLGKLQWYPNKELLNSYEHTASESHPYEETLKVLKLEKSIADQENKKTLDSAKSVMVRKALKKETMVCTRIAKLADVEFEPTLKSGAINGDGDGKIGGISVDHKHRSTAKSFSVTSKEYAKGVAQGVEAWVVTIPNFITNVPGRELTTVTLTEEAFVKLIQRANRE